MNERLSFTPRSSDQEIVAELLAVRRHLANLRARFQLARQLDEADAIARVDSAIGFLAIDAYPRANTSPSVEFLTAAVGA